MSVRNVLIATDAVGGVWTYSVELALGLASLGVEAVLAAMGPPAWAGQLSTAAGLRVIDTGLSLDWLATEPAQIRGAGEQLADLAEREGANLVQLHSGALACDVAFEVPVVAMQHSCVATWWESVRGGPLPRDFAWRRDVTQCGLQKVDAVVAPTAAFARQTERTYGLPNVQPVQNGRSPMALPARSRDDFVVTVGRLWDDGKNVRTLDHAAAQIDAPVEAIGPVEGPNGSSVDLRNLRTLGQQYGAAIADTLARRPIFASSALYEPFGLSVLEAAQAGCALVLSDIPTFRELWDGVAAFVDADDADGFASAANALLLNQEQRDLKGRDAQQRALQYTREAMARRMLGIYHELKPRRSHAAQFALEGAA